MVLQFYKKKFSDFQDFKIFTKIKKLFNTNFFNFHHLYFFPGVTRDPANLGPIGSAVLAFIEHKQTDRQTDKPNLYIDRDCC